MTLENFQEQQPGNVIVKKTATTRLGIFIVLGIFILSSLVYMGYKYWNKKTQILPSQQIGQIKSTNKITPTFAPRGELLNSFPKDLILDNEAEINSSASISYPQSTQITTEYVSVRSLKEIFNDYKAVFSKDPYILKTQSSDPKSPVWFLSSTNNQDDETSVIINDQGKTRLVTVTVINGK